MRQALTATTLGAVISALAAGPAGATVDFTKDWIGGPQFLSPTYVATDSSGDVHVSDGGFATARVLTFDPSGALISKLGGGTGSDPGQFNANEGVTTDSSGNTYVVEFLGYRVQKFDSSGNFERMWGKGVDFSTGGDICTAASGDTCQPGTPDSTGGGFNHPDAITVDPAGNVYVLDYGNQRVQKFDSSGSFIRAWGFGVADGTNVFQTCTVAATCHAGISGSGDGQFSGPIAIAADSANSVYVTDSGNDRIEKFDSSGSFTTKWGSTGSGAGQFNDAESLATDGSDNVYAVDYTNSNVQVFSSTGTFIRSFGKGVDHTSGGDTCTAASGDTCGAGTVGTADGQFFGVTGIAVDGSGNVYVTDQSPRVQRFDSSGAFVWKIGASGSTGLFAGHIEVATDSAGNVYTSDHDRSIIQKFSPVGASLNAWGSPGTAGGDLGGPTGTATDAAGNVYVSDSANNRIAKYDSNGAFVLTWGKDVKAGGGNVCTAADTCNAGAAGSGNGEFNDPRGIATDASGNVYVADSQNHRIQKFDPSGAFLASWGTNGTGNGQFDRPIDVATDSLGEIYVADLNNDRIQRFSSTGAFLGKWGAAGAGAGQFDQPMAVTVDAHRNVYVVDSGNARVQVFRPTGAFVETWGSVGAGPGQFAGPVDIALGSAARIYVADAGNDRVELFTETDQTAPQTTITAGPTGPTKDPTPTFSFSSSEPAGALFECRVDSSSQDAYGPCTSPKTASHLTDGIHRFDVRSIDAAGNVDPTLARRAVKVDTHRPSSTAGAPPTTHRSAFNVTYTASDASPATGLARVELWARRPGQAMFAKVATDRTPTATRVFSYAPRAGAGTYRFYTRAWDRAGNYELPPATPDATTVYSP